jgi:gliding motility-associated-like protein
MKKNVLFILSMCLVGYAYSQADCLSAQPFCTSAAYSFPASTNTTAPTGPDYGCLGSQPNPAFYFMQIDQPGNLAITMQSTPLVDIDFICWGPYTDPTTMCDNLTGTYIEDCSYSTAPIEVCDIANAVTGEYYILLITNFSNQNCNIDFSLTGGTGTTSCCLLGDAGSDNIVDFCNSDPSFIMEDQLLGTPSSGGVWYDDSWVGYSGNSFDPATSLGGSFSYIIQGIPVPGSSVSCPDDTAGLIINVNPDPIINFLEINDLCSDESPLTLNSATPIGGTYSGSGVSSGVFTPSSSVLGANVITYDITDANGCSDIATQNLIVNDVPLLSLGTDQTIPCRSTFLINPIITGGTGPYSYLWNDGSTSSDLTVSDGIVDLVITDVNGCIANDQVTITQDITPTTIISGGGEICDDGTIAIIDFYFNGLLPWNLTYTMNGVSSTINNINTSNYTISTSTPGQYNITVADDINGCEADIIGSNIEIILNPVPNPIINPDFYELYPGEDVTLTAGSYAYYWWYTDNDSLISESEFLFVDSTLTTYIVVESNDGCIGTSESAIVQFIPRVELFIPNTFTPNGDEHNELFVIKGRFITNFNMKITDRWGEMVYTTDKIDKYWDGKYLGVMAQQGVYSYVVDIIGDDGRPFYTSGTVNVIY